MTQRPFRHLSGEELRRQAKRADARLGVEIDRLRLADAPFRAAIDRALALDAEIEARRNRRPDEPEPPSG